MRGSAALQVTPNLLGLPSKEPTTKSSTGKRSSGGPKQRGGVNEVGSENNGGFRKERISSVQLKVVQDLLKGEFRVYCSTVAWQQQPDF
jgi:hypothetical protein